MPKKVGRIFLESIPVDDCVSLSSGSTLWFTKTTYYVQCSIELKWSALYSQYRNGSTDGGDVQ